MNNVFTTPTKETAKAGGLHFLIILLSMIGIKVGGDAAMKDPKKAPMWNGLLFLLSGIGAAAVKKGSENDWARTLLASIAAFGLVRTFKSIANDDFQSGLMGLGSKFLKLPQGVKDAIDKYLPSLSGLGNDAIRVQVPTRLLGDYLPSLNRLGCANPNNLPDMSKIQAAATMNKGNALSLFSKCSQNPALKGLGNTAVSRMI